MCANFILCPTFNDFSEWLIWTELFTSKEKKNKRSCTKHAIATLWYIGTIHVICVFQSRSGHLLFVSAKNPFPFLLKLCPKLTLGRLPLPYGYRHEIVKHDVPIFFQSGDRHIALTIPIQAFFFSNLELIGNVENEIKSSWHQLFQPVIIVLRFFSLDICQRLTSRVTLWLYTGAWIIQFYLFISSASWARLISISYT